MKIKITLEDMFNLNSATIYNPDAFKSASYVSINSRIIKRNCTFVAIKGKNFDGHSFVKDAIQKGAGSVVINMKRLDEFDDVDKTIITVKNTLKAYGQLANIWRNKLNAKVVSISGSNGKTTTKEMLYTLLSGRFKVNKTVLNNNNQIGVPLTIFNTNEKHEILILEHGTNHFGEIEYTAKIAQPDYALLTNIGDSHLEYLKDRNGVLKEKIALFNESLKNNGTIFINTDDPLLKKKAKYYENTVSFGFKNNPDIKGKILGFTHDAKTRLLVISQQKSFEVELPMPGISNAKNYLAAVSVALKLGLSKKEILEGTRKIKSVEGRLNIKNIKDKIVIDDTYNSNPQSMKESLEVVGLFKSYKNKIVILGDMLELGKDSVSLHKDIAKLIKKNKINSVLTIGKFMKYLDDELNGLSFFHKHFRTRKSLKKFLERNDFVNSVILFKGSRGMKMEEFLKIFLREA